MRNGLDKKLDCVERAILFWTVGKLESFCWESGHGTEVISIIESFVHLFFQSIKLSSKKKQIMDISSFRTRFWGDTNCMETNARYHRNMGRRCRSFCLSSLCFQSKVGQLGSLTLFLLISVKKLLLLQKKWVELHFYPVFLQIITSENNSQVFLIYETKQKSVSKQSFLAKIVA